MSIYYNINQNASRTATADNRLSFTDTTTKSLITKQSDYQVGVKRFKIPISSVPLMRIYQYSSGLFVNRRNRMRGLFDYSCGPFCDLEHYKDGRQLNFRQNNRISFLFSNNSHDPRDIDKLQPEPSFRMEQQVLLSDFQPTADISGNPSKYYDIQSHSDYARLMSRALCEQYAMLSKEMDNANICVRHASAKTISTVGGADDLNYVLVPADGVYHDLVEINLGSNDPAAGGNNFYADARSGELLSLCDYAFSLTGIYDDLVPNTGVSLRMSDLVFKIGWDLDTADENSTEFGGLCPDVIITNGNNPTDPFNRMTGGQTRDTAYNESSGHAFTLTPYGRMPLSTLKTGGLQYENKSSKFMARQFCLDDYWDIENFMMKIPVRTATNVGTPQKFMIQVKIPANYTKAIDGGIPHNYRIRAGLYLEAFLDKGQYASLHSDFIMPKFIYNEVEEKIEYVASKVNVEHFELYFNENLMNETGFKSVDGRRFLNADNSASKVLRLKLADIALRNLSLDSMDCLDYGILGGGILTAEKTLSIAQTWDIIEKANMGIYEFAMPYFYSTNDVSTGENAQNSGVSQVKQYYYKEKESSNWKRNFLNGIEILSNRLAVNGEITGGGNATRKVLTDFEIDPSTTARDYLIYTPAGNSVRYYPLMSDAPLEQLDLDINYIDIFGISRPLMLQPSFLASVKLEFRPNNMIENYSN